MYVTRMRDNIHCLETGMTQSSRVVVMARWTLQHPGEALAATTVPVLGATPCLDPSVGVAGSTTAPDDGFLTLGLQ